MAFSKITRDLSERRKQEEWLRQSEERFRLLVEGVKDYAIHLLDPSGTIHSIKAEFDLHLVKPVEEKVLARMLDELRAGTHA